MESRVASVIVTHVTCQGLGNPHQWAYKKDHSNEPLLRCEQALRGTGAGVEGPVPRRACSRAKPLLVRITDDRRPVLDKKYVVGVVFVDFRKAFEAIPLSDSESWFSWRLKVLDI